jgi:nitrogen-specific signal transduction histidine kinase
LIVNARDAMPQGGKIILRTRNVMAAECAGFNEPSLDPGDYVAIEVEDFGHGIAPEVKDKGLPGCTAGSHCSGPRGLTSSGMVIGRLPGHPAPS